MELVKIRFHCNLIVYNRYHIKKLTGIIMHFLSIKMGKICLYSVTSICFLFTLVGITLAIVGSYKWCTPVQCIIVVTNDPIIDTNIMTLYVNNTATTCWEFCGCADCLKCPKNLTRCDFIDVPFDDSTRCAGLECKFSELYSALEMFGYIMATVFGVLTIILFIFSIMAYHSKSYEKL